MQRRISLLPIAFLLISAGADAQLADQFNLPRANCCLLNSARSLADQLQDWNQLGRYHQANEDLKKQPAAPNRVVFMGDSITDFWRLDQYFPDKPYVNRGIGGQTTPQMLVRIYPDVIDLRPAAMIVLAGTNDIARITRPTTDELIEDNIMAMTELAQHHGIKVILYSVLPVSDYSFQHQQNGEPPRGRGAGSANQNDGLTSRGRHSESQCLDEGLRYARERDLRRLLHASRRPKGWLKEAVFDDGLHPNADGYKIMTQIAAAAIEKVIQ